MELKKKYGDTALVAGASEGLGAAFAEYLAAGGFNLILVARRKEPLQILAGKLADRYKVVIRSLAIDLSDKDAAQQVIASLDETVPGILVYNAALSNIGPFTDHPVEDHIRAAQVNMITPFRLVHHLGGRMLESGKGAIILMSSLAGFQGSGYLSTYAATKAFSRVLAEGLWYEWKEKGVDIMACCPGATATPGYLNSAPARTSPFAPAVQKPEDVVNECFKRLGRKPSFIAGRGNRLASFFMHRILSRKRAVEIMGDNTRKMYGIND